MTQQHAENRFRTVGDGSGLNHEGHFSREEVQLALRNRGMPLEGLRYPVTPTGMHYLLVHYDIPYVDAADWALQVGGLVAKPLSLTLDPAIAAVASGGTGTGRFPVRDCLAAVSLDVIAAITRPHTGLLRPRPSYGPRRR